MKIIRKLNLCFALLFLLIANYGLSQTDSSAEILAKCSEYHSYVGNENLSIDFFERAITKAIESTSTEEERASILYELGRQAGSVIGVLASIEAYTTQENAFQQAYMFIEEQCTNLQ